MNLTHQRLRVFEYIKAHPNTTIREIRDALNIQKPCMRISEINYAWREEQGIPHSTGTNLIVTSGRNGSREALKAIAIQ
jgi:hypothetical protein